MEDMHQALVAVARIAGGDMERGGMGEAERRGSDSSPVVDRAEGTGVVDRMEAAHIAGEPAGEGETAHNLAAAVEEDSFRH